MQIMRIYWLTILLTCVIESAAADPQSDYETGRKAYHAEDLITAMQLLESAANQGHGDAQVLLGYILDKAEDNTRAVAMFQMAAEQGHPAGELALAHMYAAGEGVEQSNEQALQWIRRAVEQAHIPAITHLAELYQQGGLGLAPDPVQARRLWQKAAELGDEEAKNKLQAK